jgi:hypothetical protein
MITFRQLAVVSLLGLATTSSSLLGAAIGLYVPVSKRPMACLLAFAAGALISALAIELAYESALSLHHRGYDGRPRHDSGRAGRRRLNCRAAHRWRLSVRALSGFG